MIHSMLLAFQGSLKDLTLPKTPLSTWWGNATLVSLFKLIPGATSQAYSSRAQCMVHRYSYYLYVYIIQNRDTSNIQSH